MAVARTTGPVQVAEVLAVKAVLHGGPFDGCVAIYDEPTWMIRVRRHQGHSIYRRKSDLERFEFIRNAGTGLTASRAITYEGKRIPVSVSKEGTEA